MIIVNQWGGRLGNNIIQLSNIIDIALTYKHNISFNTTHKYFNLKKIESYFSKYNNSEILRDRFNFFYKDKLPYSNETFQQNNKERNQILKDAFVIKDIDKLNNNDLVIHIRSGDIFTSRPHPGYIPPPLSFYTTQIKKYKYRQIIIVCEDKVNPVVNKLLELYENSVYNKNTLEEDIRLVLGATNIISSVGTFVPSLLLISNNIKHYIVCNHNKLQDYYKIMSPWKNTKQQRDYILTYEFIQTDDDELSDDELSRVDTCIQSIRIHTHKI